MAERYATIGHFLGVGAGCLAFLGCYVYCVVTGGFLFGFGLGWFPSGMVALIVYGVLRYAWGLVAILLAMGLLLMLHMKNGT